MPAQDLIEQGIARRKQMLRFIKAFIGRKGYSPSIAEIGEAVGITSPNAVRNHLQKMQEDGLIKVTPRVARSIRVTE